MLICLITLKYFSMKNVLLRIFSLSFLLSILFLFSFSKVNAVIAPPNPEEELLFGQEHNYSVVFRGNREAIVYAKIVLKNTSEDALKQFVFQIPKVTPSEMIVYQTSYPTVQNKNYYGSDRYPVYNNNNLYQYTKLDFSKSGSIYTVKLARPVYENGSSTIVIAYAAKGYVTNTLGLYKFKFETIKVPSRISSIRVSVDVDSELFLKGKKSSVNYNDSDSSYMLNEMPTTKSFSSSEMDSLVRGIGSYGSVIKSATNLASYESLVVKGEYSKSSFRLYLGNIVTVLVLIVAIFAGSNYLTKYLKKRKEIKESKDGENSKKNNEKTKEVKKEIEVKKEKEALPFFATKHLIFGLISTASVALLTIIIRTIIDSNWFDSFSLDYDNLGMILGVVLVIMVILLYIFAVFGPAIFVGVKHGWKSFFAVMVMEFIWFVFFVLVVVFVLGSFRGGVSYNGPIDYLL